MKTINSKVISSAITATQKETAAIDLGALYIREDIPNAELFLEGSFTNYLTNKLYPLAHPAKTQFHLIMLDQ